jgi:RNA polymerase sigma factor (sigma-70 family)
MRSAGSGVNPREQEAVQTTPAALPGSPVPSTGPTGVLTSALPTGSQPHAGAPPDERLDLQSTVDLTTRARAGDHEALEALCLRCLKALSRYAVGRLPAGARGMIETQDVVQEAVHRGMCRLHEFEDRHPGALIAYMRKILKNLIVDQLRTFGRRPVQVSLDEHQAANARTPLEEVLDGEQIELYEAALERLKWRDAELIRLKIDEQSSYDAIAVELGLQSANTARVAVKRALFRLAHEMSTLSKANRAGKAGDQTQAVQKGEHS